MNTSTIALLLPLALVGLSCGSSIPPTMPTPSPGPGIVGGSAGYVYGGPCPSSAPADGSACVPDPENAVVCEYGDDPRGVLCHVLAICAHQIWSVVEVSASCPPARDPGTCPASAEEAREQPCAVSASFCVFGPVPCECTSCPAGGGLDLTTCTGDPTWHCAAAGAINDPACPPSPRNWGTTCDTESLECNYGCQPPNVRTCARGVWVPSQSPVSCSH